MARRLRSDLDGVFTALADPTRRAILARLAQGDAYMSELASPHDMSFAAVSRHVGVMADAGLLERIKEGRNIRCRLNGGPLQEVHSWVGHYSRFWQQKLGALGEFLEGKD